MSLLFQSVIVGVELKLKDYALYIDVLQGKLEPDGNVKNATYSPIFSDQPECKINYKSEGKKI